jgi:hypothetical protein
MAKSKESKADRRKGDRRKIDPDMVMIEKSGQLVWRFAVPDMSDPYVKGFIDGVKAGKRELAAKIINHLERT